MEYTWSQLDPMTWERARTVPQGDRMGKKVVLRLVENLRSMDMIPEENDAPRQALDITDGRVFRWWLWICNLGYHSREVIGVGVHGARVSLTKGANTAAFTFDRTDGTRCRVLLQCRGRARCEGLAICV